jgi:hypothetical protein
MHTADHHIRVKEPKSTQLICRDKSNLMKPFRLPASLCIRVAPEPSYLKDINPFWSHQGPVILLDLHKEVKNVDHSSIPVRVTVRLIFFVRENHDVGMYARVNAVLITAHVVGSVVEANRLVEIYSVFDKRNTALKICRELSLIAIIVITSETT